MLVYRQIRSYLRNRAGLPPVTAGSGPLNEGHRSLYERELLFLHEALPKDSDVHDGLKLLDGGDAQRHNISTTADVGGAAAVEAPPVPVLVAPPVPMPVGAPSPGQILPLPPHPMRLEPLPPQLQAAYSAAAAVGPAAAAPEYDQEEDDEIRPVADERAAQWQAYRASRF